MFPIKESLRTVVAWSFATLLLTILMVLASIHNLFQKKNRKLVAVKAFPRPLPKRNDLQFYAHMLGLDLLEYHIITPDGFEIVVQRLVNPNKEVSSKPILLLHGLLQSSASFLSSGRKSIAYHLLMNGYDVWLGNNRCGFHPTHMVFKDNDPKMWDWEIHEMATFDLKTMIEHVKNATNSQTIDLCCHSQGGTQVFYLLANRNLEHIDKLVCLAPAVFGGEMINDRLLFRFMRWLSPTGYDWLFGIQAFMPIMVKVRSVLYRFKLFDFCAYAMFNYLFEWNDTLWDPEIRSIHFLFSPVYVSAKLMKWWLSDSVGYAHQKSVFDNGDWAKIEEELPKIFCVLGSKDLLVDGKKLMNSFQSPAVTYLELKAYAHLDVLWSDDVIEDIAEPMLEFLQQ
ncbi:BA75_02773T0 [Komagataella pastoris]|uniref:BA75_02773T0 n=1 Tax=Komagataella pastoris TaxID=4922 RepID=A0A1B2JBA4_PICPA|nr:BA75_02773T0 [Komagataella pastoris]